jgi:hypothetical protein
LKTQNQKAARQTELVALNAMFRLVLLVAPEVTIFKTMSHSPVLSLLAAITVLVVWLSVDVWPFRASVATPALVPLGARQARAAHSEKLGKARRNNI